MISGEESLAQRRKGIVCKTIITHLIPIFKLPAPTYRPEWTKRDHVVHISKSSIQYPSRILKMLKTTLKFLATDTR
eukprot:4627284-Prorocentrum_lima.AAC.1